MGGAESGEVARDGDEVDAAVALVELQYDGVVLGSVAAAVRQRQRQRCVGRNIYGARISQTVLN